MAFLLGVERGCHASEHVRRHGDVEHPVGSNANERVSLAAIVIL
jgi:hypothetical protein